MINIAIDGPAGAGKSTIARAVAERLGIIYLDTGAMYRAVAYFVLSSGAAVDDEKAVGEALKDISMDIRYEDGAQQIFVNGETVTPFLREPHMSKAASDVSALPAVRYKMVDLQREFAAKHDVVLDGRDIGTFVLPGANCKFYMTASPEERAARRYRELAEKGVVCTLGEVLSDIENLLAIPADKIDEQFTLADTSVQSLAASYRELAAAAEKAEMAEEVSDTLAELRKRVEELGKSETELTLAMLEAKGATEAQMEEAKALLEKLNETEIDPLGSWQEILAQKLSAALEELELFSAETNKILTDLGVQLASIAFDGALSGLSALGEALAQGGDAASSLGDALAAMADQILQQLPTLFLQAGLTLIAQGNLPLGIGLLAAAGVASFMTGVVEGFSGEEDDDEENAKGGVYGDGRYAAFAKGGAFTNGIVTSPTRFRFAKGAGFGRGLMGEAGPEAIMPLKRMSDGSLGVAAQSAGGADGGIVVVINNYSSEEVSATETAGEGGARKLEVTIGQMINSHISSGRADKAIGGRFGLRAKGV